MSAVYLGLSECRETCATPAPKGNAHLTHSSNFIERVARGR